MNFAKGDTITAIEENTLPALSGRYLFDLQDFALELPSVVVNNGDVVTNNNEVVYVGS